MIKQKNFTIFIFFLSLFFFSVSVADDIFLSLKKNKVNVRYGPSFNSQIKYVYKKINLPIKQIDTKENWRRIIDFKNNSGWIHWSQLKKVNSIILLEDQILFKRPSNFSTPIALIKKGRLLALKKCDTKWCKIEAANYNGWIKKNKIWGLN